MGTDFIYRIKLIFDNDEDLDWAYHRLKFEYSRELSHLHMNVGLSYISIFILNNEREGEALTAWKIMDIALAIVFQDAIQIERFGTLEYYVCGKEWRNRL